jgi:hypothetical protein
VVAAAQSAAEGSDAQLSTAGSVLLDGQGLLGTPADGQPTGPETLAEPGAAATATCAPKSTECDLMCPNGGCITGLTPPLPPGALGTRARGRGKPDRPGTPVSPPVSGAGLLCDVGSTGTNMKYLPDDKRFTTNNF